MGRRAMFVEFGPWTDSERSAARCRVHARAARLAPVLPWLVAVALLASAGRAGAQIATPAPSDGDEEPSLDLYASYELRGTSRHGISVAGPASPTPDRTELLDQRLRLYGEGSTGLFRGVAEVDLLTGILAERGAPPVVGGVDSGARPTGRVLSDAPTIADPRRAYVAAVTRNRTTEFKLGLQTSHWGLGIRTNDGVTSYDRLFNDAYGGDRRIRAMVATTPYAQSRAGLARNLVVALGGDFIYRDEYASLLAGDRGGQGFLALFLEGRRTEIGQYVTVRSVGTEGGVVRDITTLDTFAEHLWTALDTWDFRFAAETAFTFGSIESKTPTPGDGPETVRGTGIASEFGATFRPADLHLELRSGFASGDSDPYDDTRRSFQFDPNYRVGLILFDSYLPAVSRTSYRRVTATDSPVPTPQHPASLVHDGGVTNAMYVSPTVKFGRADGLMTGLNILWARAAQPWTDPYASFHNGGAPTGIGGRYPASRNLGWEVDTAARYRHELGFGPTLELKGEYGILVPGEAFESADGNPAPPVHLIRGTVGAFW